MEYETAVSSAARMLTQAKSVFVLSGAGLSAPSGLKTFRGTGGYWRDISVERLASRSGFEIDPATTWQWYNERIATYLLAEPNAGHHALVEIESLIPTFHHATQLVDGLLERAGAKRISNLHGNVFTVKCTGCDHKSKITKPLDLDDIPHACGMGRLRPGVVWFGENLPETPWAIAERAAALAEVILVVGTSGSVRPASSLARRRYSDRIIMEINVEPTIKDADFTFKTSAEVALPAIVHNVREHARIADSRDKQR